MQANARAPQATFPRTRRCASFEASVVILRCEARSAEPRRTALALQDDERCRADPGPWVRTPQWPGFSWVPVPPRAALRGTRSRGSLSLGQRAAAELGQTIVAGFEPARDDLAVPTAALAV